MLGVLRCLLLQAVSKGVAGITGILRRYPSAGGVMTTGWVIYASTL